MSGKKDKSPSGVNKAELSKTVREQAQYRTAEEMAVGQSRVDSPTSSSALDLSRGRFTSSTNSIVPLLEGNVSTAQRTHTSSTSGIVPLFQGNFSTAQSGVRVPAEIQTIQSTNIEQILERHAPINESAVRVLERQTQIQLRRDRVAHEGQKTLWLRFDQLSDGESSQEGHLPQVGGGIQERVLQEGSGVQKPIEKQALQAESTIQDQIDEQSSPLKSLDHLLLADPQESSNLQGRVLKGGTEGPIQGKESQVKNIVQFQHEGSLIEASSSQGGEVQDSVQEPMEGQASQEGSLVEFLYTGPPIETPPPSLPTRPKEDLPEISVENILKGTRGRRDQSLFPSSSRQKPYLSLTQRMMLDESKEIVDLTQERKNKKNRFRVKFEDDTDEEYSSEEPKTARSEEPQPPKSDSPSIDLLFSMSL